MAKPTEEPVEAQRLLDFIKMSALEEVGDNAEVVFTAEVLGDNLLSTSEEDKSVMERDWLRNNQGSVHDFGRREELACGSPDGAWRREHRRELPQCRYLPRRVGCITIADVG